MKNVLIIGFTLAVLTGCASSEQYSAYVEAQREIAVARSQAEAARYRALSDIARQGDTAAKVAAVMSIQMGQLSAQTPTQQIQMPRSNSEIGLQWASVLAPSLTQLYSISRNADVAITQSNNAAAVSQSTNQAFVGIAGRIQAPAPNIVVGGNYNSGANSGNSGRIAGGAITDNTSPPLVVTQPTPIIVTQPEPVIVPQPTPIIVTQPEPVIVPQAPTVP